MKESMFCNYSSVNKITIINNSMLFIFGCNVTHYFFNESDNYRGSCKTSQIDIDCKEQAPQSNSIQCLTKSM